MFGIFKDWHKRRILNKSKLTYADWQQVADKIALLDRLSDKELKQLFDLATLFLHQKSIVGVNGFTVSDYMKQSIALQACLPILKLGIKWYKGWSSVIVYPHSYVSNHTEVDEFGIVHEGRQHRSGEAWLRGPVILSWREAKDAGNRDGSNVIIHEFVHKLDMLNGKANGFPPLPANMNPKRWTQIMSDGFEDFQRNPKSGINSYGATNAAEFFAVLSEVFFEHPSVLKSTYPDIFTVMVNFFGQNPL